VGPDVTLAELGLEAPTTRPVASRGTRADDQRGFGFQPGLEGLRGLAVMAVLVFHGGFSWAQGGFLGVSTFFTLSGFLITTLLVAEHRRRGSVDLKRFWGRRFRRLMPAAMVCLAGVLVFAATIATPSQLVNLRGDMVAALLYVANWRFIADGASYAEQFTAPSPVLHFWSLAIEEQFYLVFPLVAAGLLALGRGSRRVFAGALVAATAASIWYSFVVSGRSIDAAYYNTFTRASELLIGSLLALGLAHPAVRRRLDGRSARSAIALAAVGALVLCGWAWYAARQTDLWLYRGGLPFYALLTAVIIVGVVQPGPLKTAFSNPTLRWLGRISYGAYLYMMPSFPWPTPDRTLLSEWPLFLLRIAVTLTAAETSYRLIEQPVRKGRRITGWHPFVVVPLAVTLLLVGIVRVTTDLPTGQLISLEQVAAPEIRRAAGSDTH
jgi:peptidoglycan/LPS O-acetylase OafA/YrhL